ncbi:MAG: rhomboid family intramembrane serine protease [Bacilli bacterium]|nr:rhomboid family intramembrane serine protease [Bacilli bacterium]MBR2997471.1 rhomboid family intramembrane serine protease [Bacilli bacterium]
MNIDVANEKDLLVMKLLHYFMTKKGYKPVIIRGIENEIWLENSNEEFRIIRLVTKSLFNDEQYDFDKYKTKNIIRQIQRKTLNPFINVLTIFTDIGYNFNEEFDDNKRYKYIVLKEEKDLYKNEIIKDYFCDLKESIDFKEDGFELLAKITSDISKKNIEESEMYNNMFKPKKPYLTYGLIVINVIVFVLMYILGNGSEDNETLIKFGANYPVLIKSGDYYRIITSAFLHIGTVHLLCNMYSLYILGQNIEHFFGKIKYIIIYLLSAVFASLFVMVFNPTSISAGASGAIFGFLGALLYFGYNYRGYIGNSLISQIVPVIIINLGIGFVTPGISNAAHIGGLIGGVAVASMVGLGIDEDKSKRINGTIITTILMAFMIYMAFFR